MSTIIQSLVATSATTAEVLENYNITNLESEIQEIREVPVGQSLVGRKSGYDIEFVIVMKDGRVATIYNDGVVSEAGTVDVFDELYKLHT